MGILARGVLSTINVWILCARGVCDLHAGALAIGDTLGTLAEGAFAVLLLSLVFTEITCIVLFILRVAVQIAFCLTEHILYLAYKFYLVLIICCLVFICVFWLPSCIELLADITLSA